ncbi:MAG: phosphate uptake regulator PhoU [Candidatus Aenigmarchaeota archaeon]|nr:phosphate uptake regulator PhoU [Candidatus Aenigmarchaeota archaeon]
MQYRKLIQHGPSSLTVALPFKWVRKHGLQKGDSVALEEDDRGLRIAMKPTERKSAISIDVSGHDWPSVMCVLTTVYRRGYDEVSVQYGTPEEYQHISTAARSLLGFAVMETRKNRCLIKSLPTELEQDFPALFRRVFLILLQELEDLTEILSSSAALKTFYHRDADLNAIVNLALRMINKGYVQDHFEELHLFHALLVLEECGDDITRFTIEIQQFKDAAKLKEAVEKTAKMLRLLYENYFQKKGSVMEFYRQYYLYWPDAKKSPAPVYDFFLKSKDKPVFYLRSIVEKVIQLAEMLLLPQTL